VIETIAGALIGAGLVFFVAGSIGLLRLPDVYSRLHALTKADNLGLARIGHRSREPSDCGSAGTRFGADECRVGPDAGFTEGERVKIPFQMTSDAS
jgi:hypothetical protein